MKAIVVTPTIGRPELTRCIRSIQLQTFLEMGHLIVVDGERHYYKMHKVLDPEEDFLGNISLNTIVIPDNTGGDGHYGHRIYAAIGHLVNCEYVLFLDEDNTFEPNHVETMVAMMDADPQLAWGYSLRRIIDKTGRLVCLDNCESLGDYDVWIAGRNDMLTECPRLVDTSAYIFRTETLIKHGNHWHQKYAADRIWTNAVGMRLPHKGTGLYTLNYRLDGNPASPAKEFFGQGNKYMIEKHGEDLPWAKQPIKKT